MSQLFTIYRNGQRADLLSLDELIEADLVGEAVADLPEHVQAAISEAIDDETMSDLARYGIGA